MRRWVKVGLAAGHSLQPDPEGGTSPPQCPADIRYSEWLALAAPPHAPSGCAACSRRSRAQDPPWGPPSTTRLPLLLGMMRRAAPGGATPNCRPSCILSRKTARAAISEWGWLPTATL